MCKQFQTCITFSVLKVEFIVKKSAALFVTMLPRSKVKCQGHMTPFQRVSCWPYMFIYLNKMTILFSIMTGTEQNRKNRTERNKIN